MSDSDVRLRLFLELEAVKPGNLAGDVKRVKKLAETFLSAPVLSGATKAKVGDGKAKSVTAATRAEVAATGKGAMIEYFDQPEPDQGVWVSFNLGKQVVEIRCVVGPAAIKKHRGTALDELTAGLVRAAEIWRDVTVVALGHIKAEYERDAPPYARLRIPRGNIRFPQRSLVTLLDPRVADRADEVKALTKPRPAHAKVTTHGDLIEIRWAKTLEDREVAQASTWHDCWIRRTSTKAERNYNEQGDEKVEAGDAEPEKPLTLYNAWFKTGFKAVLVTPKGALEKSGWGDACAVLKAKALPNGDDVEKLWIVVPLREHAIAVHDKVIDAGFAGALYPGEGNEFWNPVPKGPWLSKSTDNGPQAR